MGGILSIEDGVIYWTKSKKDPDIIEHLNKLIKKYKLRRQEIDPDPNGITKQDPCPNQNENYYWVEGSESIIKSFLYDAKNFIESCNSKVFWTHEELPVSESISDLPPKLERLTRDLKLMRGKRHEISTNLNIKVRTYTSMPPYK